MFRNLKETGHPMTFHARHLPTDSRTLSEVDRIRALVMNLHGMLRGTAAAHLLGGPIEAIHRSLDRIEQDACRWRPEAAGMSVRRERSDRPTSAA
jgi:hypothetical protein